MTSSVEGPNWDGVPEGSVVPVFDEKGVLQKLTYVAVDLIVGDAEESEPAEVESQ